MPHASKVGWLKIKMYLYLKFPMIVNNPIPEGAAGIVNTSV